MDRGFNKVMQPTDSIGRSLIADHRQLEALFISMLKNVACGEWAASQVTWSRFEKATLDHMVAEEIFLLPRFEPEYPAASATLRQNHAIIRSMLSDIGARFELHSLREPTFQRFVQVLRSHGYQEEAFLHQWTDELPPEVVTVDARSGEQ